MMKMSYVIVGVWFVVMVLVIGEGQVWSSGAVTCSPMELSTCANAIVSSTLPTPACCSKLKEQRACLCQYLKNPNLQKFINSPNARKVATTCGSPFPNC